MSTAEALRDSASGSKDMTYDTWPESLPADATELAKELDGMQPPYEPGKLVQQQAVPAGILSTLTEVRKLIYASGPFPLAIAPALANDMEILRAHFRSKNAAGASPHQTEGR